MKFPIRFLFIICWTNIVIATPININSDMVIIKGTGTSVYKGHVQLTHGKNILSADEVVVRYQNNKMNSVELIGSINKPAMMIFYNAQNIKITAKSVFIIYQIKSKIIILKQNVKLKQAGNLIQAQWIELNQETGRISAKSHYQNLKLNQPKDNQ